MHYVRDLGRALAVAGRLEAAGLRPNAVRTNPGYTVYIATADLLRLAERDEAVRRAIALYLAEKILKRHPLLSSQSPFCLLDIAMRWPILSRNAELGRHVM